MKVALRMLKVSYVPSKEHFRCSSCASAKFMERGGKKIFPDFHKHGSKPAMPGRRSDSELEWRAATRHTADCSRQSNVDVCKAQVPERDTEKTEASIPRNGRKSSSVALQTQMDPGLFSFHPHPVLLSRVECIWRLCALHSKKNYFLTISPKPQALLFFSKFDCKTQYWKARKQSSSLSTERPSVARRDCKCDSSKGRGFCDWKMSC